MDTLLNFVQNVTVLEFIGGKLVLLFSEMVQNYPVDLVAVAK